MHTWHASGQRRSVADWYPRRANGHRLGAKVPVATAICLAAAALCFTVIAPPRVEAQEKPTDPASQTRGQDQPDSAGAQAFDLSDEVVRDVLTNLQRGMETHDLDRVLDVFDAGNMKDFALFHDQMVAFFRLHDNFKFRYQLLQVTADKDRGFAIADIDLDADPSDILPTEQRRSVQMRFQMKRGPKGWKVIGLRPTDF